MARSRVIALSVLCVVLIFATRYFPETPAAADAVLLGFAGVIILSVIRSLLGQKGRTSRLDSLDICEGEGNWQVRLVGGEVIRIVAVLRQSLNMDLGRCMSLTKDLPRIVVANTTEAKARELVHRLRSAQAEAEAVPAVPICG